MNEDNEITLGSHKLELQQLTLPDLKVIMPRINAAHAWAVKWLNDGDYDAFFDEAEQGIETAIIMIAAATGKPRSEIEAMPANVYQAAAAIEKIGIHSHALVAAKKDQHPSGEAHRGG